MNELFYLQTPFVKRKLRAKKFEGRRHTSNYENKDSRDFEEHRRISEGNFDKSADLHDLIISANKCSVAISEYVPVFPPAQRKKKSFCFARDEDDQGTVGWLMEFGYQKQKGQFILDKKDSVDSSSSRESGSRWSFDEFDKSSGHLGVHIRSTLDGYHYITSVDNGSPAAAAGLRSQDRLIQINSIDTRNLVHHQVLKLLTGSGASVEIVVESDEL